MSAYVDRDQVVKFYYGNALIELKEFLPPEEPLPQVAQSQTSPISNIENSISCIESLLGELKGSQRELSYLVSDFNRMLKKIQ